MAKYKPGCGLISLPFAFPFSTCAHLHQVTAGEHVFHVRVRFSIKSHKQSSRSRKKSRTESMFMLHAIVIPGVNSSWIVGVRLEGSLEYPPPSKTSRTLPSVFCILL